MYQPSDGTTDSSDDEANYCNNIEVEDREGENNVMQEVKESKEETEANLPRRSQKKPKRFQNYY